MFIQIQSTTISKSLITI